MVNNNTHQSFEIRIRVEIFFRVSQNVYVLWSNELLFLAGLFLGPNSYSELNFIERERGFVSVASLSKERKCSVPISFCPFCLFTPICAGFVFVLDRLLYLGFGVAGDFIFQ